MDVVECAVDEVKTSEASKKSDNRVSIYLRWCPWVLKSDVTVGSTASESLNCLNDESDILSVRRNQNKYCTDIIQRLKLTFHLLTWESIDENFAS